MKKLLFALLFFCFASFLHAQTGPNLVGLTDDYIYRYTGGDTSVLLASRIASCVPHNSTMIEAPNGKLYGLGVGNNGAIIEYDYPTNTLNYRGSFSQTMGENPDGALVMATNGILYGIAFSNGSNGGGTLFSYSIDDQVMTKLVDLPVNASAYGSLIQAADGKLYGMTSGSGTNNSGTIFSYNIASGAYTVVYNMPLNADPRGSLLEVGADTLYGISVGTIFRYIVASGTYTPLITTLPSSLGSLMKASDGNLYGMTGYGGAYNKGTIFRYNMTGGTLDTLHSFGSGTDGYYPYSDFFQASDGFLYGFTQLGGVGGQGELFTYDIATSSYSRKVNFTDPAAYYGHVVEYKILPVRRHPLSISTCATNSSVSFTAADTSASALAQWQVSTDSGASFSNISGATDTTYSFVPSVLQSGYRYRALFVHNGMTDTSIAAHLTIWPIDTSVQNVSICQGQTFYMNGSPYTASGTYYIDLPYSGIHSCDSVVRLNLTIYPQPFDTIVTSICSGQVYYFNGTDYGFTGVYTDTITAGSIHGCDSIVVLGLTVYPTATGSTEQAICPGTGYTLGANTYTSTGIYTDTLTAASIYGCDSIVTVELIVLDSTTSYFYLQPSDSPYVWYIILPNVSSNINYTWTWGDSTSSVGDTVSHTYASAGYYNICLTVTDSAGCSATYCDTSVYLYKDQSGQMIYVHVIPQYPTGINTVNAEGLNVNYYAGAVHFSESLQSPTSLKLYDMSGRLVARQNNFLGQSWYMSDAIAEGVYIITLQNDTNTLSKKIVITH